MAVSEALESLDGVKNCIEVHEDNKINMMLNDLIARVEKLKLKTLRLISLAFLKNEIVDI